MKVLMSIFQRDCLYRLKAAGLGDKYLKTWDEVFTAGKALTKEEQYSINLHPFHITNYIKSYGGDWKNGEAINSEENVLAFEKVMYEAGVAVTPKELGFGWDGEVFTNEKAAVTTGGYWYKSFLKDANPDLNYVALSIPEGTTKGSTIISETYVV
jgi:multiple sugar transport system substrate-binding protein